MEVDEGLVLLGGLVVAGIIYMRTRPVEETENYGGVRFNPAPASITVEVEREPPAISAGGLALVAGVALALPVTSSVVFYRKYGGPGAVVGFFVPSMIMGTLGVVGRIGR